MTPGATATEPDEIDLDAALLQALSSLDDVVRANAARAIGHAGATGRGTVAALVRVALEDEESGVRAAATTALTAIDATADEQLGIAIDLLEHPDQTVRARAGWAIGKLDPSVAAAAIEPLCKRLATDPAIDGRFGAAWAFGRIRSGSEAAIGALQAALADQEPDVRAEAARAIGRTGPPARGTIATLIALADDADPLVREQVTIAIGRVGLDSPNVRDALVRATTDPVEYVRRAGADALRAFGGPTPALDSRRGRPDTSTPASDATALTDRLREDDAFGRAEAAWLLAKEGGPIDAESTILLLSQAFVDRDSDARWSAVRSIGRIGLRSASTTRAIVRVLRYDPDPDVRQAAAAALPSIWREARTDSIAALIAALADPDAMVREDAAEALGQIGESARPARDGLEQALRDAHGGVRARAAASLAMIGDA